MQGQDLATGNLTAPAIFALQSSSAEELEGLIDDEFQEEGSLQRAIELVQESGGIAAARKLARQEADMVSACSQSHDHDYDFWDEDLHFAQTSRHKRSRLYWAYSMQDWCTTWWLRCAEHFPCCRLSWSWFSMQALSNLHSLPDGPAKKSLELMVEYVLDRLSWARQEEPLWLIM